jgi:hypothetical protein
LPLCSPRSSRSACAARTRPRRRFPRLLPGRGDRGDLAILIVIIGARASLVASTRRSFRASTGVISRRCSRRSLPAGDRAPRARARDAGRRPDRGAQAQPRRRPAPQGGRRQAGEGACEEARTGPPLGLSVQARPFSSGLLRVSDADRTDPTDRASVRRRSTKRFRALRQPDCRTRPMAALDPKKKERFAEPVGLGCTQHATQGVGVHAPRQSSKLVIVAACRCSRILRHARGSRRVVNHALDLGIPRAGPRRPIQQTPYAKRRPSDRQLSWRDFLRAHAGSMIACDFFSAPRGAV